MNEQQRTPEELKDLKEALDWAQANPAQESDPDEVFQKIIDESVEGE